MPIGENVPRLSKPHDAKKHKIRSEDIINFELHKRKQICTKASTFNVVYLRTASSFLKVDVFELVTLKIHVLQFTETL